MLGKATGTWHPVPPGFTSLGCHLWPWVHASAGREPWESLPAAKTVAEEGSALCSLVPSGPSCSSVHPGRALGLMGGQIGESQWDLCTMGTLRMGERR